MLPSFPVNLCPSLCVMRDKEQSWHLLEGQCPTLDIFPRLDLYFFQFCHASLQKNLCDIFPFNLPISCHQTSFGLVFVLEFILQGALWAIAPVSAMEMLGSSSSSIDLGNSKLGNDGSSLLASSLPLSIFMSLFALTNWHIMSSVALVSFKPAALCLSLSAFCSECITRVWLHRTNLIFVRLEIDDMSDWWQGRIVSLVKCIYSILLVFGVSAISSQIVFLGPRSVLICVLVIHFVCFWICPIGGLIISNINVLASSLGFIWTAFTLIIDWAVVVLLSQLVHAEVGAVIVIHQCATALNIAKTNWQVSQNNVDWHHQWVVIPTHICMFLFSILWCLSAVVTRLIACILLWSQLPAILLLLVFFVAVFSASAPTPLTTTVSLTTSTSWIATTPLSASKVASITQWAFTCLMSWVSTVATFNKEQLTSFVELVWHKTLWVQRISNVVHCHGVHFHTKETYNGCFMLFQEHHNDLCHPLDLSQHACSSSCVLVLDHHQLINELLRVGVGNPQQRQHLLGHCMPFLHWCNCPHGCGRFCRQDDGPVVLHLTGAFFLWDRDKQLK